MLLASIELSHLCSLRHSTQTHTHSLCTRSSSGGSWRSSARRSDSTSACRRSRLTCCPYSTTTNNHYRNNSSHRAIRPKTKPNLPPIIPDLHRLPCPLTEPSPQPHKLRSLTTPYLRREAHQRPLRAPRQSPQMSVRLTPQSQRRLTPVGLAPPSQQTAPFPFHLRTNPLMPLNRPRQNAWSPIGPPSLSVILRSQSER